MTLEIYKLTIFFICISIGIMFIESSGLVSTHSTGYADAYSNYEGGLTGSGILGKLTGMASYMTNNTVPEELAFLALTLATFGLLALTLGVMLGIFGIGYFLGTGFIDMLPLTTEFKIGIGILLLITYIVGFMQYKANVSLKAF